MANTIQIKRKTTTGAPSLASLAVGEFCYVIPDENLYIKKDAATLTHLNAPDAGGDMTKAVYDTSDNGKVDTAENAEQLGGAAAADFALKSYVDNAIDALIGGAPGALDTLNELAAALADDAAFSATITAQLGQKLDANSTIDGGVIS